VQASSSGNYIAEEAVMNSFMQQSLAALKANGIRYSPAYNTRHTYATVCLMSGLNPVYVVHS